MKSEPRAKYLVVDTSGFIKNLQFQELAENVVTLEDVTNEIKCRRQLKRLAVLPYDLTIKSVFPENIKTVSEFAKKTGDYPSLSAVDMKVMALTYQLEKEHIGTDHLNTTPKVQKTIESFKPPDLLFDNVAGFYNKDKALNKGDEKSVQDNGELMIDKMEALDVSGEIETDIKNLSISSNFIPKDGENISCLVQEEINAKNAHMKENNKAIADSDHETNFVETQYQSELVENSDNNPLEGKDVELTPDDKEELSYSSEEDENCEISDEFNLDDLEQSSDMLLFKRVDEGDLDEVSDDDSIYDDDECGWITPGNISQAKRETTSGLLSDEHVTVACLTTDFAMQNVLLQMGLNVMSVDGRIIKQVRTYILRCHACGKTTSIMTKIFCSKCGLKTLKKVAVSVDPEGKQQIFINFKRQITARGKRWSIPKPQGGKHANNPILVEDQRIPQQRLSKKAMQRTNALDPDYIAGYSPFVMKDTTSRSIMLGFHTSRQNTKHMVSKNPHKKNGKKKK